MKELPPIGTVVWLVHEGAFFSGVVSAHGSPEVFGEPVAEVTPLGQLSGLVDHFLALPMALSSPAPPLSDARAVERWLAE